MRSGAWTAAGGRSISRSTTASIVTPPPMPTASVTTVTRPAAGRRHNARIASRSVARAVERNRTPRVSRHSSRRCSMPPMSSIAICRARSGVSPPATSISICR